MYSSIHTQKQMGFSKRKVSENLDLNFRTVAKYWDMTPDDFYQQVQQKYIKSCLSVHEEVVAEWLRQYPTLTAAQVEDWLVEHYQVQSKERSIRRFVQRIRDKYGIQKTKETTRQFEALEDPPMGKQLQVDLGQLYVFDTYSRKHIKLFCIAFVLAHSRFKYGVWFSTPPTTQCLISAIDQCFEYMGGMPCELVFDQDKLVTHSENYGEILYTYEFEKYKEAMKFDVWLCRKGDPQTKGRVEAVVKFFKNRFARNRQFTEMRYWNEEFLDWLGRVGNGKVHGTTKRVPAEVFAVEQRYLKPVPFTLIQPKPIITAKVRKDNTIWFKGNRYSLPINTYQKDLEVNIEIDGTKLIVMEPFNCQRLAEHELHEGKGHLVKDPSHRRDTSKSIDELFETVLSELKGHPMAAELLKGIRQQKPRYARDQYHLIQQVVRSGISSAIIEQALSYCINVGLYSAVHFRDSVNHFSSTEAEPTPVVDSGKLVSLCQVKAQKRSLTEYAALVREEDSNGQSKP